MNDMTTTPVVEPEQVSISDIAEAVRSTALLADLTISLWSGERTDHKVGSKLKEDANAIGNTGRYIKNLLAGCDAQLKGTRAAYTAARQAHYSLTLPWVSNPHADRITGSRLLPTALFERYLKTMSQLKRAAETERDKLLDVYPQLIVQAQGNLGGLADPSDYPPVESVKAAFQLAFDFQPIPAASSFQGLPEAALERLGRQLQSRQQQAALASQAAMWERVKETVGHLVERVATPDSKFKAATVENVRELITLLPGFNCTGDSRVATVVNDIASMLNGVDASELRKDAGARASVLAQAQSISAKLDAWGL